MTMSTAATMGGPRPARGLPRLQYASFEARVAAATLDLLVMFIIGALLVTAGSLVVLVSSDFEKADPSTTSIYTFWGCVGAIAPALLLYFFISYAWKGQTIGKAVMQLMVIRSDGRPLGVFGSMARVIGQLTYLLIGAVGVVAALLVRDSAAQAGGAIGGAVILIVAGLVLAAFDSRRRALHDRIAGTIVVRIR
jgi:uncharacterized RDD family membrane protein YckC